jgi:hypothetical protein
MEERVLSDERIVERKIVGAGGEVFVQVDVVQEVEWLVSFFVVQSKSTCGTCTCNGEKGNGLLDTLW